MQRYSAKEIFDKALASEHGIELVLEDHTTVRSVRRHLYAEREKYRAEGNHDFDVLSFIIKGHDLWVAKKGRLEKKSLIHTIDINDL